MYLLLDENVAVLLEDGLQTHGHSADHVETLDMKGESDQVVLPYAVSQVYDAIITKDRYSKGDARLASLRAMRDGLRIIELRFRQRVRGAGSDVAQLQLVLDHLEEIERAVAPDSPVRQLVINAATGAITKVITLDEVAAELRRLEP